MDTNADVDKLIQRMVIRQWLMLETVQKVLLNKTNLFEYKIHN